MSLFTFMFTLYVSGYNGILSSSSSSNQDTNSETKDEALPTSKEVLAANE